MGFGLRVLGFGFRGLGLGFWVSGFGFRVEGKFSVKKANCRLVARFGIYGSL